MPATPHTDTAVVDTPWDGAANEARLSNDAGQATYEKAYAWRDPAKDANTKGAYKLPHHEISSDGKVGAANVNGVRAALSALGGARGAMNIPESDKSTVRGNLQKHLDKFNSKRSFDFDDATVRAAVRLQVSHRVWAIHPHTLTALIELDGQLIAQETLLALEAAKAPSPRPNANGIAIVALKGVLMPSIGGLFALLFGGEGLSAFQSQLAEATNNPDVDIIVMDVDSPGGLVDQIPETADDIQAARAKKPIVAVANTQAASAAYWLASQADEIVVTPSGEVGSIGVYQLHRDLSQAHAMRGIAPTLVSAGKYKVEGNPYEPLGDEARQAMQDDVDDYYGLFTAGVAKGRGVSQAAVKQGYGEGRSLHARQAVAAGLADRVDTLQGTVRRLASPRGRAALMDRREAGAESHEPAHDTEPTRIPVTYTPDERSRLLAVLAD